MESFLGTSPAAFVGLTVIFMGAAAYLAGQSVALTWRPRWQVCIYCFLLALATRFLHYALFGGELLSPTGFITDLAVLTVIGLLAYRLTRVSRMVAQYPWLYERRGFWGYREKPSARGNG